MEALLTVKDLRKSYGKKEVIHGISFEIYRGEILCFLGPNGAAKSTTISILSGVLSKDSGELYFEKQKVNPRQGRYRQALGVVPQEIAVYEDLTAAANVNFFAALYGVPRSQLEVATEEALRAVGLWEHRQDAAKTFSGGMKRRLNIACGMAHKPQLLIMDEPTVGIDPQSRNHILASIKRLQAQGMAILYTTHYMEEVEAIADRILIMDHGKMLAEGTLSSLKGQENSLQTEICLQASEPLDIEAFYEIAGVQQVQLKGERLILQTIPAVANLDEIIRQLLRQKQKIQSINVKTPDLETVFLNLTGRSLRD